MLNEDDSMIKLLPLVLASGSPRRAEILRSVGWDFTKAVPDVDESERVGESPEDYVKRLAIEKAEVVTRRCPDSLVLAADTTVVVDEHILGKPIDLDDARRMLRMLSGRWHDVLTGVAIAENGTVKTGIERTGVKFLKMTEAEVDFLSRVGDP